MLRESLIPFLNIETQEVFKGGMKSHEEYKQGNKMLREFAHR